MANQTLTVPQLRVGDELLRYGMQLRVREVVHYEKRNGYGADCTQARCEVLSYPDTFPLAYLDRMPDGGYSWTVQGNERAHVTVTRRAD
jgi:hypothetical protein